MKNTILLITLLSSFITGFAQAETSTVKNLLTVYSTQGATTADAQQGKLLWQKTFPGKGEFVDRSCTNCHTDDLTQTGKHIKTNKPIKPMSPSVNPQRLTSVKKINKWFKRNCKWTMGRECTAQEKADILVYIENESKF